MASATTQEKMAFTKKLVDFLEGEMGSGNDTLDDRIEVLMLAYHVSTNTHYFKSLLVPGS